MNLKRIISVITGVVSDTDNKKVQNSKTKDFTPYKTFLKMLIIANLYL